MRKKIELTCPTCQITYQKDLSEYKRNTDLRRISYCSIECIPRTIENIPIDKRHTYDISKHSRNLLDEYTDFRYYMKNIKSRSKEIDIALTDLKEQWIKQDGICPYSNVKLIPVRHRTGKILNQEFPYNHASLDRIDSSKGYIKGNIEFVSLGINYLKNNFTKQQTMDFINLIVKNKTSLSGLS